jgi:1,2-diacylglycerol 3-beta-galactosyltransferase
MKKIYFTIYDMGAGHRSTANALKEVIEQQKLPWKVEVVEVFQEVFGTTRPQFVYNNWVLKKKWAKLINDPLSVPLFKLEIRLRHRAWRKRLQQYWREHQPDLVVSLMPLVNRVLCKSLRAELPETPFVTLPIDLADSPPQFWIEQQEQFFICPTERMVEQAQQFGYREEQIFRTSGVVINPQFYEPIAVDRRIEKQRLGLDPDLPTALIMFGGHGSNAMIEIAQCLERSQQKLQLIFICGRNEKLANALRASQSHLLRFVEGFTDRIPYYMYLSDFFIGKPGPGAISEALVMKLPVITDCNALTLFTERYNAQWVVERGVGIVVRDFRHVDRAVAELLQPENFARYQANAAVLNNQGVFEVVDILARILKTSSRQASPHLVTPINLSSGV